MSVAIRLKREGRKNLPSFRIHVTDSRGARDGASIENLGFYDPRAATPEKRLQVDKERAQHWMKVGAKVSDTVASLFRQTKVIEGVMANKPGDRSGRKAKTATKARRTAAKKARSERKAARPPHRRKPKVVEKKQNG
ncbi:MAG: 30S ribosomal protein S16 [Planctomycetes bacterium]|nr:30S ribosomal protein S16 [Planctomycetota bacterium]